MKKEGWGIKKFEDCLQKVTYTTKLKSENYLLEGQYPIVSQEDSLISGYWDNMEDVFHVDNPLIIFGDHTRILKYVDFSFVLGADGVKILLPKKDLLARFLYYYLLWYNIPSLGYSRHYKLLKEISIPLPPLPIQEQIVKELNTLSDIIAKKKEQLAELDTLAQATFYDMFGDPVDNEKCWNVNKLEEIAILKAGTFVKASDISKEYNKELYKCFGANGVRGYVSTYTHEGTYVLIGRQGALCGNVSLASGKFYATEHAVVVSPITELNTLWLLYELDYLNLNQYATGAAQPGLSR